MKSIQKILEKDLRKLPVTELKKIQPFTGRDYGDSFHI